MKESAYQTAGVNIAAGNLLVERIKPAIHKTRRAGVMGGIGGFGALFDLKASGFHDPVLVSSTDGVGTKLRIAIETGRHETIGIDLVAMCVNDVLVQGAEPLFFLDYFASGRLDVSTAETIISGIARGCAESGCALIGGETAEMPGMYAAGDYDLAGFTVGAVERDKLLTGENIRAGDIVLGLSSNGLHSNGFSLVRKIAQGFSYDDPAPFDPQRTLGEALLDPTRLYVRPVLKALRTQEIKALAHITGGGLIENIPRVLPDSLAVRLDARAWPLPPVFEWLKDTGNLTSYDLSLTFNCGIGMAVICAPDHADSLCETLEESGETVWKIGEIIQKTEHTVLIEHAEAAWRSHA